MVLVFPGGSSAGNIKTEFELWARTPASNAETQLQAHGFVWRKREKTPGGSHVIDTVRLPDKYIGQYQELKVDIRRPGTRWGSSLWRFAGIGGPGVVSSFEGLDSE